MGLHHRVWWYWYVWGISERHAVIVPHCLRAWQASWALCDMMEMYPMEEHMPMFGDALKAVNGERQDAPLDAVRNGPVKSLSHLLLVPALL